MSGKGDRRLKSESGEGASEQKEWDREEVVILVVSYFQTKNLPAAKQEETYYKISDFLRKREERITGNPVSETFRNYAGIRMQTARIRCLDPDMDLSGMQGTKLQKEVVREYLEDPEKITKEAREICFRYTLL